MRLFIDLDTRAFIESETFPRAITSLELKRGDIVPVELCFVRDGAVQELAAGATGRIGIKPSGQFGSSFYLALDTDWQKSGTGTAAKYLFSLNLATAEIESAFLAEPETVPAMLEVEWIESGLRTSSVTLEVELQNDVNRGNEGVPRDATPPYPLPGQIELIARKGQPQGYAELDAAGKVPQGQLPPIGPTLRETSNRFTADHAGWKVGDIIRQLGDSTPASFSVEVTSPVPGGVQEVLEITALAVPEGETSGFQLSSNYGSSEQVTAAGPLSDSDHASQIQALLDAWGQGTTSIAGAIVTFTFNSQGSAGASASGGFANLNVVTPGADQLPFAFAGDFYDQSGNYYSAYAEVYGPMPAEGFAQEIANSLTNNIPFLNIVVNGTVLVATYNFSGQLPSQPSCYDPYGNGQLWQTVLTDGVDGVPPGTFLVSDVSVLDSSEGYKGIGDTVDFLSGYGAPTNSVGSVGNGYVDLNYGDFYHRSENGWFFVLNIKGPQGPQGSQGQQGPIGPQGPSGVSGLSKAFTSSDIIVDGTGFDKIWPIRCYGSDGAGTYIFTGIVRVHQATIATGRKVHIKSLSNNSATPGGMGFVSYVKYTDAAGLDTPGTVVTTPIVHNNGGWWDMGPDITLDGCYALVAQWTITCKFNTAPNMAFEIYGGTPGNPLVVKAGSGSTLIKLG